MKKNQKIKHPSPLEVVHEAASGLYQKKMIDMKTMKEFDALCLPSVKKLKPKDIKKIRTREKVSQPVFAIYLNTSTSTVKQWETGEKHPRGISLKMLNLVESKGLEILS